MSSPSAENRSRKKGLFDLKPDLGFRLNSTKIRLAVQDDTDSNILKLLNIEVEAILKQQMTLANRIYMKNLFLVYT